jgi:predicted transcriptional regulator
LAKIKRLQTAVNTAWHNMINIYRNLEAKNFLEISLQALAVSRVVGLVS